MPVNTTHPDYDATLAAWSRARDVIAGEDALKSGGVRYLPRLDSQSDEEYAAYKERAAFFNATARTAEGYVGLIFRRPPFVKTPEVGGLGVALSEFANDADMLGTPLVGYAKNVVGEVISVGRAGTLIDWESEVENRAYVSRYAAENILNWRVERINGRSITTMVALLERGVRNAERGMKGADCILADLGISSMQLDDPARGFSTKGDGPLDMRMNPQRGQPASALLAKTSPNALANLLRANADEPRATELADALAGHTFTTTRELVTAVRAALPTMHKGEADLTVRRVFQALRITVNDEFSALDTLLRHLPACLNPGGRVAMLTFHSGEDRRVKHAFAAGLRDGVYAAIAEEVIRPTVEERRDNPRSSSAKLRWARKAA